MRRMAAKKALVHQMRAIETIGVITTIAGDDLVARLLVGLHDGVHGRDADAAAHAGHRPHLLDVGGASERPKDDGDLVAHLKLRQLERRRPHRLEHDGDPALLRVGVRDGSDED